MENQLPIEVEFCGENQFIGTSDNIILSFVDINNSYNGSLCDGLCSYVNCFF